MSDREKQIQKLCEAVLSLLPRDLGDRGADCPFCYKDCNWLADNIGDIGHASDCPVLIAKDLTASADTPPSVELNEKRT